jgi:hypothetical protein
MLHWVSESMITRDVDRLRSILLSCDVASRSRLEDCRDCYSMFVLPEQQELLGSENLTYLIDSLEKLESRELHMKYVRQYIGKLQRNRVSNKSEDFLR